MKRQTIIALKILLVLTVVTGILYPLLITGVAQVVFNHQANGSFIKNNGIIIGSELIGQKFDSTIYFWSRPSSIDYNPLPSGGSNYGPTSTKLKMQVSDRRNRFAKENGVDSLLIPVEMVTASASGLDPHISPEAAFLQVDRIVKARNFNTEKKKKLTKLIQKETEERQFSFFGEERINVLKLNIELDKIR